MIVLYHCVAARSLRPLWMLEELGLPYELRMLDFPPRVKARGYLDENPQGTIPLLLDGPVRMVESAAMCEYLARRYGADSGLDVGRDEPDFAAYLDLLHLGEATLTNPLAVVVRQQRFEPPATRSPAVAEAFARTFSARLRSLSAHLQGREYVCAGRFTAADVSIGFALLMADFLGLSPRFSQAVQAYWERLQARPAYQRARQAEVAAARAQGVSVTPAPLTELDFAPPEAPAR